MQCTLRDIVVNDNSISIVNRIEINLVAVNRVGSAKARVGCTCLVWIARGHSYLLLPLRFLPSARISVAMLAARALSVVDLISGIEYPRYDYHALNLPCVVVAYKPKAKALRTTKLAGALFGNPLS
jgi:hypothetical protein